MGRVLPRDAVPLRCRDGGRAGGAGRRARRRSRAPGGARGAPGRPARPAAARLRLPPRPPLRPRGGRRRARRPPASRPRRAGAAGLRRGVRRPEWPERARRRAGGGDRPAAPRGSRAGARLDARPLARAGRRALTPGGGFWDALERFLLRERAAGRRDLEEIWSQPLEQRIENGDAIAAEGVDRWDPESGRLVLRADARGSRFRAGDALRIGDGADPAREPEVTLADEGPDGTLEFEPGYGVPPQEIADAIERSGGRPVLDRGEIDLTPQLLEALRRVRSGAGERARAVRDLVRLRWEPAVDDREREEAERSADRLEAGGVHLESAQREAFVRAWSARPVQLVQGPPGTGKTWLAAHLLAALAWRGEALLVTAQTHRAVDNVLHALAAVARRTGHPLPLVRVAPRRAAEPRLRREGIRVVRGAAQVSRPRRGGLIVGATLFGARRFESPGPFDRVLFDEAAQITLPHALCALLAAPRWILAGDDRQLGPVIVGDHPDPTVTRSVFEHLRDRAEPVLLDRTHRMNDAVCAFPSRAFYGGRLRPTERAAARRLRLASDPGPLAPVLDPERGAVLVRLAHEGHRTRCPAEADLAAAIAAELLGPQRLPAGSLALVSPFRAQNREIASRLRARLPAGAALPVIDTVERIQGQEREAVVVSLACSDPDALRRDTEFFFSENRLCVTLTRARTKLVVLASRAVLDTYPRTYEGLLRLDLFHRMFRELPQVDGSALAARLGP
ncbi:MAG: hypothetical protein D6718_08885 [Acidobacteria bacterium]|nr:MAG: hypothetical protein D6718_08885 [Acidobacteriota bacterium]